jgi:hypothetical protein
MSVIGPKETCGRQGIIGGQVGKRSLVEAIPEAASG